MSSQGQYPGPPPGSSYPPPGVGMGAPPQPMPPGITSQTMPVMPNPAPGAGPRRSSRALPIVVAAGLAVGVFGGLIIVYGTNPGGEAEASSSSSESEKESDDKASAGDADKGAKAKRDDKNGSASGSSDEKVASATADAGTASFDAAAAADAASKVVAAIDAGTTDAAPKVASTEIKREPQNTTSSDSKTVTKPTGPKTANFNFVVEPANLAGLKITVDGQTASGSSHSITSEKSRVRIRASARGYVTWSRNYRVRDATVKIRMRRPSKRKDPSGLIDL